MIKRGEIYYASLYPTVGSEQSGFRPVLIIQNDIGNAFSPTTIIVPLTSAKKTYLKTHIKVSKRYGVCKNCIALAEQIRTIDKQRLSKYIGTLDEKKMKEIDKAIKISLNIE